MDIKSQNLSKMSKDQLYRLVVQKEISDADRAMVKNELVQREADILYNQAVRARAGEKTLAPAGMVKKSQNPWQGSGPGMQRKLSISLTQWLLIIFVVIVLAAVVYAAFIR